MCRHTVYWLCLWAGTGFASPGILTVCGLSPLNDAGVHQKNHSDSASPPPHTMVCVRRLATTDQKNTHILSVCFGEFAQIEHVFITCTQIQTQSTTCPWDPFGLLPATTPPKATTSLTFASVCTLYKRTHTVCSLLSVKLIVLLCRLVACSLSLLCSFPLG